MCELTTERLIIKPLDDDGLAALIKDCADGSPELSAAYSEMLAECTARPERRLWHTAWELREIRSGAVVGSAGFRGLSADGAAEIGYGIEPQYRRLGYASECVAALCGWAFAQDGVRRIEAETEADNAASARVLIKSGFHPTGSMGDEGPRYALDKPQSQAPTLK